MEQPLVANVVKENVRRLRKALAGSRYEIVNHPTLGYELIVGDVPARRSRRRGGTVSLPAASPLAVGSALIRE
jgi:hypothetical protein